MKPQNPALINADDLSSILNKNDDVILLDATYGPRNGLGIPGFQYFDIDVIADQNSPYPHSIPSPDEFQTHARALGVNAETKIIVYDSTGFWMAASRVWWLFRLFGHENIYVLDGGLPHWNFDLDSHKNQQKTEGNFTVNFQPHLYESHAAIVENIDAQKFQIMDARPPQAFDHGHIENSLSTPLPNIITSDGRLKDTETLKKLLPIQNSTPIVASCGSGVTACALALAYYECGEHNVGVYDGSWTEYASKRTS